MNQPAILPAWVISLAQKPKPESPPPQAPPREMTSIDLANGGTPYGIKALECMVAEMLNAPLGERNNTLNRLAMRGGALKAGGELTESSVEYLKIAAKQAGLSDDEIAKTFRSGFNFGLQNPAKAPETAPRGRGRPKLTVKHYNNQGTGTDGPAPDKAPNLEQAPGVVITEDFLAQAFVGCHGQDWRFNFTDGQWYFFNGNLWRRDDTRQALTIIREICRNANNGKASLGKAATARGVETFAQADPRIATTSKLFDADDLLLACPNGVVNLQSGLFRPGQRKDFLTMTAATNPAPSDDCPRMKEFINQVTRGDIAFSTYIQRVAGYCLSGLTTEHALFVLIGPGGNGKSVFENILRAVLNDYATTASFDVFAETRTEQHPAGLAALVGKRLVTASEIRTGQAFAESRIKAITGGEDISARFMRQNFFTFKPRFKAMIAANTRPALRNVDAAIKRRVKMLPFEYKPPAPDKNLEAKLKGELPGILRWMVDGFLAWQREGLNPPAAVENCTSEYFAAEDVLGAWLEECCLTETRWHDSASRLFNSWKSFKEARGEKPGTQKAFSGLLESRGFSRDRKKTGSVYEGLCLK
jgi:putative DNA primase/helicase